MNQEQTTSLAFQNEVEKIAKLRMGDIEDALGFYLSDRDESRVRDLIREREQKSFALRHPWISGVPTLGIAPAVAKANAVDIIMRKMLRGNPGMQQRHENAIERRWREMMEEEKVDVERTRAEQPTRMVGAIGASIMPTLESYFRSKREA